MAYFISHRSDNWESKYSENLDKETNLHYNYRRDYDPAIGRYVQSDPIGLRGGINTYGYAEQNSISYIDPNGLIGGEIFGFAEGGSIGFGGAIALSRFGLGVGGEGGIEVRQCCGEDKLMYKEFILVAKGGPSLGASERISPQGVLSVARIGNAPRCIVGLKGTLGFLSTTFQIRGMTMQGNLQTSTTEVGITPGIGISGVLNVFEVTYPIWRMPSGVSCACDETR